MQEHNKEMTPSPGVQTDNPLDTLLDMDHLPLVSTVKVEKDNPEIKKVVKAWCDRAIMKWVLEFDDGTEQAVEHAVIRKVRFSCKFMSDGTRSGCGRAGEYRGFAMGTFNPLDEAPPESKGLRLLFDRVSGMFLTRDTFDKITRADILVLMDGCHSRYYKD